MNKYILFLFFILTLSILVLSIHLLQTEADKRTINKIEGNVMVGLVGTENIESPVYLLFIHRSKSYVHVYQIPPGVKMKKGRGVQDLIDPDSLKMSSRNLEKVLNVSTDFHMALNEENVEKIIHSLGGVEFFNQYSKSLPKGRVFIDYVNYRDFLKGVENVIVRRDLAYSIWYNLIYEAFSFYSKYANAEDLVKLFRKNMVTDLSKERMFETLNRFLGDLDRVYVSYSRMNLEYDEDVAFPFQSGVYDQGKFADLFEEFEVKDKSVEQYPIVLQVKNATDIKRLAAKTAGTLRIKKCDVREYLNSDVNVKRSLILDRCGSSIKKSYLKKVTKVDEVVYLIDHREQFDFTLYIGNDYYAIKNIR